MKYLTPVFLLLIVFPLIGTNGPVDEEALSTLNLSGLLRSIWNSPRASSKVLKRCDIGQQDDTNRQRISFCTKASEFLHRFSMEVFEKIKT